MSRSHGKGRHKELSLREALIVASGYMHNKGYSRKPAIGLGWVEGERDKLEEAAPSRPICPALRVRKEYRMTDFDDALAAFLS